MSDADFIPEGDDELLAWSDFLANLKPEHGVSASDLAALKAARDDFCAKIAIAKNAQIAAEKANAELFEMDWGKPLH